MAPAATGVRRKRRPSRQGRTRPAKPTRATVHPDLSPEEADALNRALSRRRSREEPGKAPPHPYQDEALDSLVQAQEIALRVASLSEPDA